MALQIDHTVPPVPLAAGSYLVTTAGGYRFIYPVVALVQMTSTDDDRDVCWRAAYMGCESELVDVPRDTDLVLMTTHEAACLWRMFEDLNTDRVVASGDVSDLLEDAGTDGVDYMTVHRVIWDAGIKEADQEREFLQDEDAVTRNGRVYAARFLLADTEAVDR